MMQHSEKNRRNIRNQFHWKPTSLETSFIGKPSLETIPPNATSPAKNFVLPSLQNTIFLFKKRGKLTFICHLALYKAELFLLTNIHFTGNCFIGNIHHWKISLPIKTCSFSSELYSISSLTIFSHFRYSSIKYRNSSHHFLMHKPANDAYSPRKLLFL